MEKVKFQLYDRIIDDKWELVTSGIHEKDVDKVTFDSIDLLGDSIYYNISHSLRNVYIHRTLNW